LAGDVLHGVEILEGEFGILLHDAADFVSLLDELVIDVLSFVLNGRGVHDQVQSDLTNSVDTEIKGGDLLDLGFDFWVNVEHFNIGTSQAALSIVTLGGRLEGVEGLLVVGGIHGGNGILEGVPLLGVDVILIDFVSKKTDSVVIAELDDGSHGFEVIDLGGGISGVNDDHTDNLNSLCSCFLVLLFKVFNSDLPGLVLIRVVWDFSTAKIDNTTRVKGVLRARDHDTRVAIRDMGRQNIQDGISGTISHLNVVRAALNAFVSSFEGLGEALSDEGVTLGLGICTNTSWDSVKIPFGSLLDTFGEAVLLDELGVHEDTQNLSGEGDGGLAKQMWVSDIDGSNFFERISSGAFSELFLDLHGVLDHSTGDGVLETNQVLVHGLDVEELFVFH